MGVFDADIEQLRQAGEMLKAIPSQIQSVQWNNVNVERRELLIAFEQSIYLLELLNGQSGVDPISLAANKPAIDSHVANILSVMSQALATPTLLVDNGPNLLSYIWGLRTHVLLLVSGTTGSQSANSPIDAATTARWAALSKLIKDSELGQEEITKLLTSLHEDYASTHRARVESEHAVETIRGFEREAANAKTNSEANSLSATAEREKIEKLGATLDVVVANHVQLQTFFESKREEIEGLLAGASKRGLAVSFADRGKNLLVPQLLWAVGFCLGIGVLTYFASHGANQSVQADTLEISKTSTPQSITDKGAQVSASQSPKTNQDISLVSILTKIALASPIVWFTWFAAVQYTRTSRLREDYAFKQAAAMAFVGYRNEVGSDAEMVKMLQEYAIRTFGANPLKATEKGEPVTPLHDLLDKALEKGEISKIAELIKAINPNRANT